MAGGDRRYALLDVWIYRSNMIWMVMMVASADRMMMSAAAYSISSDHGTAVDESCHCANPDCLTRSLGATLIASLSTLVLFGAANWGHELAFELSLIDRLFKHILYSYLNPWMSLFANFYNAMAVWNNTVPAPSQNVYDRSTIAVITNCPMFIPIPQSLHNSSTMDDLLDALGDLKYTSSIASFGEVDSCCPSELSPAASGTTAPARQLMHRSKLYPASVFSSHLPHDMIIPDNISTPPDLEAGQMKFLQLRSTPREVTVGRRALLELGLIPKQEQLRFLRSRDGFQEVVVCLQASGYVLGVGLRVLQRLAISPVEAILTILCILIICQTSLSIYACSNFQRPLLLRLDRHQFQQWTQHVLQYTARDEQGPPVITFPAILGFWVSTILLFAIPSIYYTVPSLRPAQHFYLLCVLSALLFLSYTVFMFTALAAWEHLPPPYHARIFWRLLYITNTTFFSSMIIALISTIKDWDVFDQRIENSFSWILPHVSPTS